MALTSDLISQFVKATNDKKEAKKESTTYGTAVVQNGSTYVQIDGSELLTPVSTTASVQNGERVLVTIKNHSVIITGNLSSPAARVDDVEGLEGAAAKIAEFEIVIAEKADISELNAANARIDDLVADNVLIQEGLYAAEADIDNLQANTLTIIGDMTAAKADIETLKTTKLDASVADITYATIEELKALDASFGTLDSTYADFVITTTEQLEAHTASIDDLETKKLDVETAEITYANIDFSNIGKAAMEYFYANSGLIESVTINDGTITGHLVGVTIRGDLIEANTLVADKLVIQGEDGLFYKLNTDGIDISAEQTEYNSLNGKVILAKSITATQISVSDLVAFDATIGGFNITENAIFSEVKDDEGNTTRGIYMDTDGQFNFGDGNNFVKYYRDEDGNYKLAISAETIMYSLNGTPHSIADLGLLGEYVKIGTYEGEPCIELGEADSDFKMIITNTRILFMEGSIVPAYITNQSLHIKKAVIEEELEQGGFVWKKRSNGNLGLMWKGVTS